MIGILVADDHSVVRRGLMEIIDGEPDMKVVAQAASGRSVLKELEDTSPDLIILDITMPDGGGLEVLREVRSSRPSVPILVLSVHSEDQYALRVLKAGAAGYLMKDCAPEELLEAIRRIASGSRYITPDQADKLADAVSGRRTGHPHDVLSDREFQTLRLIGMGRSVSEIADELALSPKTVSTYRRRMMDKMKFATDADIIRYALDHDIAN